MSEEKKSVGKWYGWAKNLISAVAGAVISCAATLGIIGKSDADIAKEKVNGWMEKTDTVYVQVETVTTTLNEVKSLLADKKYLEALAKLDSIKNSVATAITTVKELRDDIAESAKVVTGEIKDKVEDVKDKVDEVKDTVKDAVDGVKDAVGDKPSTEEAPAEN